MTKGLSYLSIGFRPYHDRTHQFKCLKKPGTNLNTAWGNRGNYFDALANAFVPFEKFQEYILIFIWKCPLLKGRNCLAFTKNEVPGCEKFTVIVFRKEENKM